jgi:hypothetical protein
MSERQTIVLPEEILQRYVGIYALDPSFQIEIELQNNALMAKATGQPSVELFAEAEDRFFIKEIGAQVIFNVDSHGSVLSLTFSQGGQQMEGKKMK